MSYKIAYPDMPGWKGDKATGREAAFAIAKELPARQQQVWDAIAARGVTGATCDELQDELDLPAYCIRPRASELERKGKLWPVGRRMGVLGHKVTVYSTVKPADMSATA
ncbi:hypothetical protein EKN06_12425 [Croceicoccus ponticola]|uniref:Uncharacterized protein n=1 Tax=Croceicoccus ponticola TaxID=2217664 RepID=A0A437GVB1_9SPHN|nr:hypothetical protein [Croceicoccus ponticola]RVQ65734.1 hypothetical protein EKN06_12425 [Croceicoccus ponticola]